MLTLAWSAAVSRHSLLYLSAPAARPPVRSGGTYFAEALCTLSSANRCVAVDDSRAAGGKECAFERTKEDMQSEKLLLQPRPLVTVLCNYFLGPERSRAIVGVRQT